MTFGVLLSLGHFCEIHGPSVVLHSRCIDGDRLQNPELRKRLICFNLAADSLAEDGPLDDLFLFNEDGKQSAPTVPCEGCSLHANTEKNDIITFNEAQNKCFISEDFSSRSPFSGRILDTNTLRVTCLRSMSSEVHPKNHGGVYFSTESEHVISFLFSLQDSKSRGFQRKYSIFVMYDKSKRPFANFNFLIKNITMIIANLQKRAKTVYRSEMTPVSTRNKRSIILDNVVNAGKNLNYFEELFDRDTLSTSKNKIKARSLGEITGDCNIFYTLHLQFAAILGEVLRRDKETESFHSNDLIDLSQVRLISNFFCNDYSKLRQLYSLTGKANFLILAANVVVGSRIIVFDGNQKSRTQEVVEMLAKLLPQERIEVQTEAQFDARSTSSLSPNDSNLLGVCAKFPSDDVTKLMADFYLCVEIVDTTNTEKYTLKLHCCDEIAAVKVPTYVRRVEELLQVVIMSDITLGKRIDEMKFEWMSKSKMFIKNVPRLNLAEVATVKRVLKMSDNDLQMVQFWSKAFVKK